jgi:hypothetical protein
MKFTLYEDPVTHKFALVRLPDKSVDDDNDERRRNGC